MSKPIPIVLLSDAPDCNSGLARITRDLATRLYKSGLPIRVATAGFNGTGSKDLPFQQYQLGSFASSGDIPKALPALADWFGDEKGILFTIYDIHRLEAFRYSPLFGEPWKRYLGQKEAPFYLAGYIPIDADTGEKGFTAQSRECLRAFDKLLAYGPYGQEVLKNALSCLDGALPKPGTPSFAPHGIDLKTWCPQMAGSGRAKLKRVVDSGLKDANGEPLPKVLEVGENDKLLGVVATNQARKDFGSFFQIAKRLADADPSWKFWIHTDRLLGAWSIPDLIDLAGLEDRVFVTAGLPDENLAELYSDCTATIAIGLGEGFGYPIAESLACGTPCLHIDYAGGADLLPTPLMLPPAGFRTDGPYCLLRPIIPIDEFVSTLRNSGIHQKLGEYSSTNLVNLAEPHNWPRLWRDTWLPWWKETLTDFEVWRDKV